MEIENKPEPKQDEKYEEYDRIVRELAFEKRARPTDRTKSEEEIALEEKNKLEKLEVITFHNFFNILIPNFILDHL